MIYSTWMMRIVLILVALTHDQDNYVMSIINMTVKTEDLSRVDFLNKV